MGGRWTYAHRRRLRIGAVARDRLAHTAPRVRLVEVGRMGGPTIALPADVLRSSGLEVLGSGPGTIPLAEIIGAIPQFMAIAATGDLPIDIDQVPLAEVESAWHRHSGSRRIVLRPLTTGRDPGVLRNPCCCGCVVSFVTVRYRTQPPRPQAVDRVVDRGVGATVGNKCTPGRCVGYRRS